MLHPARKTVGARDARLDSFTPERLMNYRETDHLRVLIANERKDRLALVAPIVVALGHEVIARTIEVEDVGAVTARERPDVALVGLGESSEHALDLIDKIVREATCPVIVLLHARDPGFVKRLAGLVSHPVAPGSERSRRDVVGCAAASQVQSRARQDRGQTGVHRGATRRREEQARCRPEPQPAPVF